MLFPAFSSKMADKASPVIDCICLFALVCGMAASMGSAIFLVADGTSSITNGAVSSTPSTWTIIAVIIVAAFVTSAISGVMNGIRILSTINSRIYMVLGLFVFLFGPTAYILKLTVEGFGAFVSTFCQSSRFLRMISSMPRMPLMGVRTSWLSRCRNSVFALLAESTDA